MSGGSVAAGGLLTGCSELRLLTGLLKRFVGSYWQSLLLWLEGWLRPLQFFNFSYRSLCSLFSLFSRRRSRAISSSRLFSRRSPRWAAAAEAS
jgi:hypothetical protein